MHGSAGRVEEEAGARAGATIHRRALRAPPRGLAAAREALARPVLSPPLPTAGNLAAGTRRRGVPDQPEGRRGA
eukprot:5212932-Pyramimonas_sp.AAC.1